MERDVVTVSPSTSTLDAIVKISPLPEIDALLAIWKLASGGQITLR